MKRLILLLISISLFIGCASNKKTPKKKKKYYLNIEVVYPNKI